MSGKYRTLLFVVLLLTVTLANTGCFEHETPPPVLGDYAKHYLQGSKYTRLIIEIDYVDGYAPSPQAMDNLRNRINSYCDKQEVLILKKSFTTAQSTYSDEDIENLEEKHRDYRKSGKDIVAYILYLNGKYSKNENVLGVAYGASSIAIFKEKIDDISIPFWAVNLVDNTDYEKSVVVHEFGHLLALVSINYVSDRTHESANEHHCIHDECVMYYQIETVSISNLISQEDPEPPSDFYSDCKYDLNKIKSGEY